MVPIWLVTPFEWNFSMVKKIHAFKKLILMLLLQEICQYPEFTVCHLQLRIAMKWIEIGTTVSSLDEMDSKTLDSFFQEKFTCGLFWFITNADSFQSRTNFVFQPA